MDFRDELMTGWVSGTFFISRTTLGALDDLGYVVDYSNAGLVTQMVEPGASSLGLCLFGVGLLYRRRQTDSR